MKIVVLDGYTLNPGDLIWADLEQLGACEIFDRTPPPLVLPRAQNAEILLTNKTVLDRGLISQLPGLRYIGVLATGYNVVDLPTARERRITVTNAPNYGTASVAQMTLALLLELAGQAGAHSASVRDGEWGRREDFCYTVAPLVELDGLTMGIVGWGRIGRAVGRMAQAFGMKLLVHTPRVPQLLPAEVEFVPLEDLFQRADVVSFHCPLTAENRHLLNAQRLALMKPSAFFINTSRGLLVDEAALAEALNSGKIAGAAVDVLSTEPPPQTNPLLHARNCLVTPHMAWATRASRQRLMEIVVENLRAFLEGRPRNVVS